MPHFVSAYIATPTVAIAASLLVVAKRSFSRRKRVREVLTRLRQAAPGHASKEVASAIAQRPGASWFAWGRVPKVSAAVLQKAQ
ncbi:MAG: hypothetical protein ABI824_18410 [Acidobacteriota bacterium]